jgi:hypothetical protein
MMVVRMVVGMCLPQLSVPLGPSNYSDSNVTPADMHAWSLQVVTEYEGEACGLTPSLAYARRDKTACDIDVRRE